MIFFSICVSCPVCVIACVSLSPVSGLCDNLIQDIIYSYLVLPNRITIPLVGEAQLSQLRFPIPKVGRDGQFPLITHTTLSLKARHTFHCMKPNLINESTNLPLLFCYVEMQSIPYGIIEFQCC
jgi:hypothetical protein